MVWVSRSGCKMSLYEITNDSSQQKFIHTFALQNKKTQGIFGKTQSGTKRVKRYPRRLVFETNQTVQDSIGKGTRNTSTRKAEKSRTTNPIERYSCGERRSAFRSETSK